MTLEGETESPKLKKRRIQTRKLSKLTRDYLMKCYKEESEIIQLENGKNKWFYQLLYFDGTDYKKVEFGKCRMCDNVLNTEGGGSFK